MFFFEIKFIFDVMFDSKMLRKYFFEFILFPMSQIGWILLGAQKSAINKNFMSSLEFGIKISLD